MAGVRWWAALAGLAAAGMAADAQGEPTGGHYGPLLLGFDGERVSGAAAPDAGGCRVRFAGHRGDGGFLLTAWVDGALGPGVGAFLDVEEGPAPAARLRLAEDLPGCPARRVGALRFGRAMAAPWREVAAAGASAVALRSVPREGEGVVGSIPAQAVVAVLDRRDGWALAELPGGGVGWVDAKGLIVAAPPLGIGPDPTAAAVARVAGVWRRWGEERFVVDWRGWRFGGADCRAPVWRRIGNGGVAAGCRAPAMEVEVAEEGGATLRVSWLGRRAVLHRDPEDAAGLWP